MMILDFKALSDAGLLWKINHDILHPLGLALCREPDGTSKGAIVSDDGNRWEFPTESNERGKEKYEKYIGSIETRSNPQPS